MLALATVLKSGGLQTAESTPLTLGPSSLHGGSGGIIHILMRAKCGLKRWERVTHVHPGETEKWAGLALAVQVQEGAAAGASSWEDGVSVVPAGPKGARLQMPWAGRVGGGKAQRSLEMDGKAQRSSEA